jgi:uncharacterized membrane protein YhaH (DUF805 family)
MTFADSVSTCFGKYADFSGRASRSEFWWWVLFTLIGSLVCQAFSGYLSLLFEVGTLLPYCAVTTRRLHDTNRSGWIQLVALIPLLGWILLIVWCAQPGIPDPATGVRAAGVNPS